MSERAVTQKTQQASMITAGFGQSMLLTFVNTFLLMYLIQYARVSSKGIAAVTLIITAARIFDALNDPFMGGIVDKTRTRWGKMRPYILISAGPVAVLSILLFCVPDITETGKIIFFGVVYLLWGMAYTVCDVPFWGLIGAAFTDKGERGTVISRVRAVQSIGTALAVLGAPWLAKLFSFAPETTAGGWSVAAAVMAVLGMGMFTLAFFNTRERKSAGGQAVGVRMLLAVLFKNKPLFMVLLGSLLGFGRTIIQAGGAVFAVMAYNNEGYFTFIGAALIAGMVLASFAAPALLKRTSDKRVLIISSLVGAAANFAMYVAGYDNIVLFLIIIFIMGTTVGLFMVTQTTMIADAVDYIERKTGVRNDGISFSSLTFISKLMGTVGVLAFGAVVSVIGYQEGAAVTGRMLDSVFFSITVVPAVSCLLSVVPFALYKLNA
jgi:sugar (glycoside-pentoside-hexuronide) transporter